MKITISQQKLSKALSVTERVISRNPSLPILSNFLIKTDNGRLKISATNLEVGINYFIGSKIEETGEIAIPARIFTDFIGNLKEEKITLTTKNNILHINTDKYKTQILGFDSKEYPIIPKIKNSELISLSAKLLKSGLNTIIDSIAISETRPELSGAFVQLSTNSITLAATDSFRLTERVIEIKNKEKISFILPRTTIMELIKILGDIDEDVELKYGDNQISLSGNDFEIVSRLIDGNYPDYRKVIPEKYVSKVLIKKDDLEKNVRMAGLFSSSVADIKINCNEEELSISSKNSDKGEIQTKVASVLKNEPFEISLNHYYLLDGLKIMPTENVIIEYTGQGSPLVIKPEYDNKSITYLIMPLRK